MFVQMSAVPQTSGRQCDCGSCTSVSASPRVDEMRGLTIVHSGEVTHYQCREAFSRKLKETRTL